MYIGPKFCRLRDGTEYEAARDYAWDIGKKNSGLVIVIPRGFRFESSVPWVLWWFLSPHNPHFLLAAMVHDWLLEKGFRPAFAAGEWHDAARAAHAPKGWTTVMFIFVALFTILRRWNSQA